MKFKTTAIILIFFLLVIPFLYHVYFSRDDTPNSLFSVGYNIYKKVNPENLTLIDERFTLREDQYWYEKIYFRDNLSKIDIFFDVEDGPMLDYYLIPEDQFEKFKADKSFKYIKNLSSHGTKISENEFTNRYFLESLSEKYYYMIIDNSDLGKTSPPMNLKDDVAKIQIKLNATYTPKM